MSSEDITTINMPAMDAILKNDDFNVGSLSVGHRSFME